jgi:SAM-dependent methyltransferase
MSTPYTALANGYDLVMSYVDYEAWAEYIDALLAEHAEDAGNILEVGCGTGSLAITLAPMGPFNITATDGSEAMVAVAKLKPPPEDGAVSFGVLDFRDNADSGTAPGPFDAALLLYDGLNYLLEEKDISALLEAVAARLKPGGVFILDQSTPINSVNNEGEFEDEGSGTGADGEPFAFVRYSAYDPDKRIHTTRFVLTRGEEHTEETHLQRAYELGELRALIAASPFQEVAAYDGFSLDPANSETERVHWVLERV